MELTPIVDLELEYLFRSLRSSFLENINSKVLSSLELKVLSSLVLQCHINEFIYPVSNAEERLLTKLADEVALQLKETSELTPQKILCLAAFRLLYDFSWGTKLTDEHILSDVLVRHVQNNALEEI